MAFVLRHAPKEHGLDPDTEGFVPLVDLLAAARRNPRLGDVQLEDVLEVAKHETPSRFEVRGDRMRAVYGHSVRGGPPMRYPPSVPPELLFHGTHATALPRIRVEGLRPMSRQYVHLSTSVARAREVGGRRTAAPVILVVRARRAHEAGIVFHAAESQHWLVRALPPEFIDFPAGS